MIERNVDLQTAVDLLTDMLVKRVEEYIELKRNLPTFGTPIDHELARYNKGMEDFARGLIYWYYQSPRT